jgi:ribonuclease I
MQSFLNVTVLHYNVCTKAAQSNQQLALSRLMRNIHCGSAIFPYQVFERRPAQETLISCAGLHNKTYEGIEHSSCFLVTPANYFTKMSELLNLYA